MASNYLSVGILLRKRREPPTKPEIKRESQQRGDDRVCGEIILRPYFYNRVYARTERIFSSNP